ncbi:MAG: hypothetical protein ACYDHH_32330 [Solirubrobacteraceae bacterium]
MNRQCSSLHEHVRRVDVLTASGGIAIEAGVVTWRMQPPSVVIVTADPASLMDRVLARRRNRTIAVGGWSNR